MRFGICGSVEQAGDFKAGGADFIEENVQGLLQGLIEESQWQGKARAAGSVLPIEAANMLVPAALKITGPSVDSAALRRYMANVTARARQVGIGILVFGSAGARNVPEGFDRDHARRQILDFLNIAAELVAAQGLTLVVEPINRTESNIINSVGEAMEYVKAIGHRHVRCLVDSYHFWLEKDRLDDLRAAMPWIVHVHVADEHGRVPPGESGKSDYQPFFSIIKKAGYTGRISVETPGYADYPATAARFMAFLRRQWETA